MVNFRSKQKAPLQVFFYEAYVDIRTYARLLLPFYTKRVGNKANRRISKWVFQENKARQLFRKNKNFLPSDTHTYVCISGGKKCKFSRKFGMLCFLETPKLRFALLPYYPRTVNLFQLRFELQSNLKTKQPIKSFSLRVFQKVVLK